jgi:hypothetical protein
MDDIEFELVENARSGLSHYSLERLKTIAPTFRERSAQRLACVELIAEKERELARLQMGAVSRKASLALSLALIAVVWPIVLLGAWIYFEPFFRKPEPIRAKPPAVKQSLPSPAALPEEPTQELLPEPLPPMLGEPPPISGGG